MLTRWLNRFSDIGDWIGDRLLDLCLASLETAIDSIRNLFRAIDRFLDYVVLITFVSVVWVLCVGMFCVGAGINDVRFKLHGWTCQCHLL